MAVKLRPGLTSGRAGGCVSAKLHPKCVYGRGRALEPPMTCSRALVFVCADESREVERGGLADRRCAIADAKQTSDCQYTARPKKDSIS